MSKQRVVEVPIPDVTEIGHLLKYSSLIRPKSLRLIYVVCSFFVIIFGSSLLCMFLTS